MSADATREISDAVTNAPSLAGFASQGIELPDLRAAFDAGLTVINAETWARSGICSRPANSVPIWMHACGWHRRRQRLILPAAESVRARFTAEVDHALQSVDVIVLPTLPALPITLEAARNGYVGDRHVVVDPAV